MEYQLQILNASTAARLVPLYRELARHHNEVSEHFGGSFPGVPVEDQLCECVKDLSDGKARVAIIEEQGEPVAFCKVDVAGDRGYLDELAVLPGHRGRGLGSQLMDWADGVFRECGVRQVELRVVVGNDDARLFYERRGFLPSVLEMKRLQRDDR